MISIEGDRAGGVFLKGVFYLSLLALLLAGVGALAAYLLYEHLTQPGIAGESVAFRVPQGATGAEVAKRLEANGLVEREVFFRMALRLDDSDEPIKHGLFSIPQGLSPLELARVLRDGTNRIIEADEISSSLKMTIPEGFSIRQAAELFEDSGGFIAAAADAELVRRVGIDAPTLEGFLMPNTYFFDAKDGPAEVVRRMVAQFEKEYEALQKEFPDIRAVDKLKIVTVASLVEEEARDDEERPLIAAVIYNRLDKNRALEMDSTLQFALNKYGQRLVSEDKEVESPYNTYKHRGLPPGPISSPGVASIRAAMAPADVAYLYFVSNADGKTHTFSKTLVEHNKAVARYRKAMREQRRSQAADAP